MKKISAIFLSIAIFAMTFVTAPIVSAATIPPITITASMEKDSTVLNIFINNPKSEDFKITSLKILGNNSFAAQDIGAKTVTANDGKFTISVTVNYLKEGNKLQLEVNGTHWDTITVDGLIDGNTNPSPGNSNDNTVGKSEIETSVYVSKLDTKILYPGTSMPFYFIISEKGGWATDLRVMIEGEGDYANMFTLDTPTGWDDVQVETAKQRIIRVSPKVKDGSYRLKFNFTYMSDNKPKTQSEIITVFVQGNNRDNPYIQSAKLDKQQIGKENKAKLTAKIVNPTDSGISDVRVSFNAEASKGFTLYENFTPVTFSAINENSSKDAVFSMYIDSSIMTGNHPVVFDISYRDSRGNVISNSCAIYTQVTRTPDAEVGGDDKTGEPRIIVSKYSIDVKEIKAGQPFTLDFTLENTSAVKAVSNIKVGIDSEAGKTSVQGQAGGSGSAVFFPAEGSNSFFIEKLGAKQTISKKIKLMASQDVEPGVYPVIINSVYDSDKSPKITSEERIAFPVSQEQRLDITGLNILPEAMMGQPIPINFQYINKGKATIYNFAVHLEGDFTLDGGDVYVGNLTAGYNDYFDSMIVPTSEGEKKGTIVLKYEDSLGNEKEQRTEFTVNVMPMDESAMNPGGMNGGEIPDGMQIDPKTGELIPAKKGSPVVSIVVSVVVLLIAGAVTFLIIKKKRKAKKELMLDEEN